jgi:hypothetical protein
MAPRFASTLAVALDDDDDDDDDTGACRQERGEGRGG